MLGSPHGWRGGAGRRRTAPTPRRGPEDAQGEGAAGGEQSLIRECGWTDRGTGGSGGGPPHEGPRAHPQAGGQPGRPRPGRSHAGPEGGGELRCCPAPRSRRQLPVGGGVSGCRGGRATRAAPPGSARAWRRQRLTQEAQSPTSSPAATAPPDTRHPPPRPDAPPESRHSPNIPPTPRGSRSRGSRPHGTPAGSDPHPHPGGPRTWAGGDWGASPRFCPSPDCAPRFARGAAAACPPTPICKHPWEGAGLSPHPGGSSGAGQGVPLEQAQPGGPSVRGGSMLPGPPQKKPHSGCSAWERGATVLEQLVLLVQRDGGDGSGRDEPGLGFPLGFIAPGPWGGKTHREGRDAGGLHLQDPPAAAAAQVALMAGLGDRGWPGRAELLGAPSPPKPEGKPPGNEQRSKMEIKSFLTRCGCPWGRGFPGRSTLRASTRALRQPPHSTSGTTGAAAAPAGLRRAVARSPGGARPRDGSSRGACGGSCG